MISTKIPIRDIASTIYYWDEIISLIFYLDSRMINNLALAKIIREIYIIEDLKIKILIEANILTQDYITIDYTI